MIARTFTSILLYRNFRLLWMGSWTEHLGEWMETAALLWLINQMTHSPFMATLMVTLRFLPMAFFSFIGGVAADRMNRRTLLIYALTASAVFSAAMAAMVHTGLIEPWHLLAYSALTGVTTSFNHPARHTLVPNLVRKEHYLNAIVLDNASVTASRILGGLLAGLVIDVAGTTPVLGLRAAGAVVAILWLARVHAPATPSGARAKTPFSNFLEGIGYLGKHRGVLGQVLLFLLPMFISNSYTGLLPYIATDRLHVGAGLYGVMNAAPGAGAVIATLILASHVNLRRKGFLLLLAGIAEGMVLVLFGLSSIYLLSVLLLVVIGGANNGFTTLNNTIIQEMIPDEVRGRVMSLRDVSTGLGPAGSLLAGALAGTVGVSLALGAAGGIAIAALLGILVAFPRTRQRG